MRRMELSKNYKKNPLFIILTVSFLGGKNSSNPRPTHLEHYAFGMMWKRRQILPSASLEQLTSNKESRLQTSESSSRFHTFHDTRG